MHIRLCKVIDELIKYVVKPYSKAVEKYIYICVFMNITELKGSPTIYNAISPLLMSERGYIYYLNTYIYNT